MQAQTKNLRRINIFLWFEEAGIKHNDVFLHHINSFLWLLVSLKHDGIVDTEEVKLFSILFNECHLAGLLDHWGFNSEISHICLAKIQSEVF